MGYFSHDDDTTYSPEPTWYLVGETQSVEAGLQAAQLLVEKGYQVEFMDADSEVDSFRRVLEDWPNHRLLMVDQDPEGALEWVKALVREPPRWETLGEYFKERTNDELYRVMDGGERWGHDHLALVQAELTERGLSYGSEGTTSQILPLASLLFGLWFGPFALLLVSPWIDKMKTTDFGGKRAFYAEATRALARRMLRCGMILSITVVVFLVIMSQLR